MTKFKYILVLSIVGLLMVVASAQNFYYYGSEKVPLNIQTGRKALLYDSSKGDPKLPRDVVKEYKALQSGSLKLIVYQDTDSTLSETIQSLKPDCSIYDCYYIGAIKGIPSGSIYVQLKNLSDTVILKEVTRKFDCVIEGPNQYFPKFYKIYITPGEGRNPVNIANKIYETGYFLSSEPSFLLENIQESAE